MTTLNDHLQALELLRVLRCKALDCNFAYQKLSSATRYVNASIGVMLADEE